ncbi:MAG: hypothetical protein IKR61_04585 [Lachnospiraceae bacterium]|nr:hypothetical protein [Lachnospiraceae bacterium]
MSIQPMKKGTRIVTNSATEQHRENVHEYEILSVISQGGSGIVYSAALQKRETRDRVILKEYYPSDHAENYERIGGVILDKNDRIPCCEKEHYLEKALQEYANCDGAAGSGGTRNITIGHVDQVEYAIRVTEPDGKEISTEHWIQSEQGVSELAVFSIMHPVSDAYSLSGLIRRIDTWCDNPKMAQREKMWTLSLLSDSRKQLSPYGCILALEKIVQATGVMHRNEWVHEDIKPENMLFIKSPNSLTDLFVQFIDFGSSQQLLPEDEHPFRHAAWEETGKDRLAGTSPGYRPPELRKEDYYGWTEPADYYQCGAVLYYMLCGEFPPQKNGVEVNDWKLSAELDNICNWEGKEDVKQDLLDLLLKATQNDPTERYSDTAEFLADIKELRWKLSPEADRIREINVSIEKRTEHPQTDHEDSYVFLSTLFYRVKELLEGKDWFGEIETDRDVINEIFGLDTITALDRAYEFVNQSVQNGRVTLCIVSGIQIFENLLSRDDIQCYNPAEIEVPLVRWLKETYCLTGDRSILPLFHSLLVESEQIVFSEIGDYLAALLNDTFPARDYREEIERYLEEAGKLLDDQDRAEVSRFLMLCMDSKMQNKDWEGVLYYADIRLAFLGSYEEEEKQTKSWIHNYAFTLSRMSRSCLKLGRVQKAYEYCIKMIDLFEGLHKSYSEDETIHSSLVGCYIDGMIVCVSMGMFSEATQYTCKAFRHIEEVVQQVPAMKSRMKNEYFATVRLSSGIPIEEGNPHIGELYTWSVKLSSLYPQEEPKEEDESSNWSTTGKTSVLSSGTEEEKQTARTDHIRSRIHLAGESSSDFPASYRPVVGKKLTDRLKKQALEKLDLQLNENDIVAVLAPSASLLGIGREVILFTKAGMAGTCFKRKGLIRYEDIRELRGSGKGTIALTYASGEYEEDVFKASEVLEYIFS